VSVNVLVKFDFNMLTEKNLNASSLSWSRISCESVCVCKSCIRVYMLTFKICLSILFWNICSLLVVESEMLDQTGAA